MNDERREHLYASLVHLLFLRDLLWRTGAHAVIDEEGFAYGQQEHYDLDALYEEQGRVLMRVLDEPFSLSFESTLSLLEDEERLERLDGLDRHYDHPQALVEAMTDTLGDPERGIILHVESSDEDRLFEWVHWMQYVRPGQRFFCERQRETPHVLTLIDGLYDASAMMDLWETCVTIKEMSDFVRHVANADAWRRGRRICTSDAAPAGPAAS